MLRFISKFLMAATLAVAALALSACGGGSGSSNNNSLAGPFMVMPSTLNCSLDRPDLCFVVIKNGEAPFWMFSNNNDIVTTTKFDQRGEYRIDLAGKHGATTLSFTTNRPTIIGGAGNYQVVTINVLDRDDLKAALKVVPDAESDKCKADGNCVMAGETGSVEATFGEDAMSGTIKLVAPSGAPYSFGGASSCGPGGSDNGNFKGMVCPITANNVTSDTTAWLYAEVVDNKGDTHTYSFIFKIYAKAATPAAPLELEFDYIGTWGDSANPIDCSGNVGPTGGIGLIPKTLPSAPGIYTFEAIQGGGVLSGNPDYAFDVGNQGSFTSSPVTTASVSTPGTVMFRSNSAFALTNGATIGVFVTYEDPVAGDKVNWSKQIYCQ
ncbi:MAG: hypothetical protein LBG61_07335 [Burkholderiales bacterium]|jgi:hypothetical protein|nr:hypothetical protein [Burkholderiales bacterium]